MPAVFSDDTESSLTPKGSISSTVGRILENCEKEQQPPSNEQQHSPVQSIYAEAGRDETVSHVRSGLPTTPPSSRKGSPLVMGVGETPSSFRASQSSNFHRSQLGSQRERVALDHVYVPCMPLQQFREHALPRTLSDKDVEAILEAIDVKALKQFVLAERHEHQLSNVVDETEGDEEVSEETQNAANGIKNEQKVEKKLFKHITSIYDEVVSAGKQVLNQQEISKISYNPSKAPISMERKNTSVPDCNLVLATSTSCQGNTNGTNVYYCDIFATCEFKKNTSERAVYDNYTKLIWNMRHIMREDPTRRFVFGISIENRNTRIWQANRADVFVSEKFDYVEKLDDLLRVFAQLIFAKKTDLGWDDSIIRTAPGTYKIRVGNNWFKTDKVLSSFAADDLTGHASRVWLATSIGRTDQTNAGTTGDSAGQAGTSISEQNGNPADVKQVVIKDVWPGLQTMPEHEVQELLLSELAEGDRKVLKEHLFTISSYEVLKIDGKEDNTLDTILHGLRMDNLARLTIEKPVQDESSSAPPSSRSETRTSSQQPSTHAHSGSLLRTIHRKPARIVKAFPKVRHRYHYRMAMEEVATPVWQIDDLEHALIAYRDALFAVTFLSELGWVHRDISSGNVYYYKGKGILGDFEYIKKINSGKRFETKTGTRDFMALEVAFNRFLFSAHEVKDTARENFRSAIADMKKSGPSPMVPAVSNGAAPRPTVQHFFHNPLHDVESVWWGCIELLFKKRIEHSGEPRLIEEYKERYTDIIKAASEIFPDHDIKDKRLSFFSNDDNQFETTMAYLPPALTDIIRKVSDIRKELTSNYVAAELATDGSINAEAYSADRIVPFARYLNEIIPLARGMKLRPFPDEWNQALSPSPLADEEQRKDQPTGSKRQSSEAPVNPRGSKRLRGESTSDA